MSANSLAKSAKDKDQNDNDLGKKHAPRCDKDNRATCPSKLSKRELEDLYYSLLENNLELKRTVNALNEKNRILSTKVQRIMTQTKTYMSKDCCAAGKAVINEQKAALADLNKANEALADRVRRLSTQLCTAKQFLKQTPSARHCYKCFANTTTSVKNLSTTSLQNKSSNVILKSAAASAIQLDHFRESPSTRAAETNTMENDGENNVKGDTDKVCNENRCRTTMEQFKEKIGDLEEELAKTHAEYSNRMTQLESQVSQLQSSALRSRSESEQGARARGDLELARRQQRAAEHDRADLDTELSIEKKKVAELEMRLKAAECSQQVAQTVERHLSTASRLEEQQLRQTSVERCDVCSNVVTSDVSPQPIQTMTPTKTSNQLTVPDDKMSKSDDSGYADHRQESDIDNKNTNKSNQELMNMIEDMQAQLDALKLITAEKGNAELEASPCNRNRTFDQYYSKSDEDQEIKDNNKFLPKHSHTPISILEPVKTSKERLTETSANENMFISERRKNTVSDKLDPINKIDIPSKDFEHPSKDNYERNDSGISNLRGENTSDKQQAVDDNTDKLENNDSICENHEYNEHSRIHANRSIRKQDGLKACSSKEIGNPENVQSISLQHAFGSIDTKPYPDNASVTSSTPAKCKRGSLVIFENNNGTGNPRVSWEIEPKSITNNNQKDSPPEPSKSKTDDSNFQQIPRPSPVSRESTSRKRRVALSEEKIEYDGNNGNIEVQNSGKTISIEQYYKDIKIDQDERNNVGRNVDMKDNALKKIENKDVYDNSNKKGLIIEVQYPEGHKKDVQDNNSSIPIPIQKKSSEISIPGVGSNVLADYKGAKDKLKRGDYESERLPNGSSAKMNEIPKIQEFDICQHYATICSCPSKRSPSLGLLRCCGGGRALAALPRGGGVRRCGCSERPARSFGSALKDKPIGTSTPKADRAPPPTSPHTYTIDSGKSRADSPGKSRADSPANTDNEISVMTDLPSEKDDTYEYDRLSPGERGPNGVSTETESYRGLTLSEGEVPGDKERRTSKSLGEVRRTDYEKEFTSYGEQKSPAQKMEATLLAISQELARCRTLLLSQRPTEQKDAATGVDTSECALRKTTAKSRIDGTVVPTCLFVMHIVSVVFSDEALLGAHEAHLMLTWQFADRKAIVVPLKADRVVHFDFSTQQEVQMTRELVDYLQKEDLLIMISAMDNVKNNIASCALPLRQVLLNINENIILSLPLGYIFEMTGVCPILDPLTQKAGPYLRENAPATGNTGNDVGVLDISCKLFCEEGQLAAVNQTIAQYTENPKSPFDAEQPKEKNPSADTEAKPQKLAARQASFQRHKFMLPSDQGSSPRDARTSLEGRNQVGSEVPRNRHDKNVPLLQYYEKDNMKRNGAIATNNQQATMSSSRTSKFRMPDEVVEITILWLTLNENVESMLPKDRKLYVAYTFLGRDGAELETPVSVPRPLHYTDKCIFNYRKAFNLTEMDMRVLEHMVSCRSQNRSGHNSNDCIVFTVVSEPPEDPLGLDNCEDIGFAFLYLGDLLAYCSGESFTEVLPVRGAHAPERACGVLAVRVRGLQVLRECQQRTS